MSTTRSLALLALVLGSCGGRAADLVIDVARGSHPGELQLYVCGEAPTSKCKLFTPFPPGSSKTAVEVGVFVNDDSTRLHLQLQLQHPNVCADFLVDFGMDPLIDVQLDASGAAPFTITGCASCTPALDTCNYDARL
jgi:hypothetical protein